MNTAEARSLEPTDKVLWAYQPTDTMRPCPGTVTDVDLHGAFIMWADSPGLPTHYDFDEQESWLHIQLLTEELTYAPIEETAVQAPSRK